jgi:hypothetical protein
MIKATFLLRFDRGTAELRAFYFPEPGLVDRPKVTRDAMFSKLLVSKALHERREPR